MRLQSQILRFRKQRQAKDRSNPLGTIGFLLAAVVSILIAGGVIYGVNLYTRITKDLPSPGELEYLLDPINGSLLEPTQILDRTGEHVLYRFENPAVGFRRYVSITDGNILISSDVPEYFILATVAAVDPDFFQRPETFLAGILDRSQDPIPETLVEDLLLWDEMDHPYYEIRLKLVTDQIIAAYGRGRVLEWYLNSIHYGNQIYGAAQAAQYYFGKELEDLNLSESAMLAAVANYPALNPLAAPVAAEENQSQVLDTMVKEGFISETEAERAARVNILYADSEQDTDLPLPAFVGFVLDQADDAIPQDRLLRGGYRIISTLDFELQETLNCTALIMSQRVSGQDPQLGANCPAGRLLPRYSGPYLAPSQDLLMDLVVYDPLQGELLGMVGFSQSGVISTIEKTRDPGSLITPYLYLNAFTQGFEPASLVWDLPLENSELTSVDLHPGTRGETEFLGPISMRTALRNDFLSPAMRLLDSQGLPQLRSTLGLFGHTLPLTSMLEEPKAFMSSPLEMIDLIQGYGVFVNRGYLKGIVNSSAGMDVQPAVIVQIEDLAGREIVSDYLHQEQKIISEELAYLINHVLSDQEAWLDPQIADVFRIGRTVGVKTGYVPGNQSGWVIGYTPQIVIGVWTGSPEPELEELSISPVEISANIWRAITQHVSRDSRVEDWEMPPGITTEDVCYPSGDLPTEYCPRIVREVFIQGNEPLGLDTLYQALEVNRETGLLASVFTPASQIENRVYLKVPNFAESWVEDAGLDIPPEVYDLGLDNQDEGSFRISEPENLSFVRGKVRIVGSIPEEGFVTARLQFGVGLNPRTWQQTGDEIASPGEDQFLGTWDTAELDEGIYAVQLVVIQENQQIQKRSLILSVDNTPPEMIFITDLSGGEIPYQRGKDLLLEVRFTNPSEIEMVDFILDDDLLASKQIEPFIIPWRLTLGTHELVILAQDQAGNEVEHRVVFRVMRE
jgi:membrane carboxypeptidase/penicillin-binding protein